MPNLGVAEKMEINESETSHPGPDWAQGPEEPARFRIARIENYVGERYRLKLWHVQRSWGRIVKTLCKGFVLILCHICLLPFVILCKRGGYPLSRVLRR